MLPFGVTVTPRPEVSRATDCAYSGFVRSVATDVANKATLMRWRLFARTNGRVVTRVSARRLNCQCEQAAWATAMVSSLTRLTWQGRLSVAPTGLSPVSWRQKGIVTQIQDRRGVGKSSGDWAQASLVDVASDYMLAANHLKSLKQFDRHHIRTTHERLAVERGAVECCSGDLRAPRQLFQPSLRGRFQSGTSWPTAPTCASCSGNV
jgi:hypothetical protein